MEFKDKNNHYLHPDFEDKEINNEKKLSPLALLAQTCNNVGSAKSNNKDVFFNNRNNSPSSSINGFRKFAKRNLSDSSSNSSSTDSEYPSPTKKSRIDGKNPRKKKSEIVAQKTADTSSEAAVNSGTSLISNLIQFVKNSNNAHLMETEKIELLNFLANQTSNKDKQTEFIRPPDYTKKSNQFNVEKGYHLETAEESTNRGSSVTSINRLSQSIPVDSYSSTLDSTKTSAIKYCMYCGKLIPVLPILLAHIRLEHGSTNHPDSSEHNPFTSLQMPNVYDLLSNFNPYVNSSDSKSHQTFSFLNNYMNSSFKGLNNLIC